MNSASARVELLELTTCGTNICPAGFTGRFCETLIGKDFKPLKRPKMFKHTLKNLHQVLQDF